MAKITPTNESAATKVARKRTGPAMTMLQRFELQAFVKDAAVTLSDAAVAKQASSKIGRPVLTATVSEHRKAFGIASVARPTYAQLEARVEQLEAYCEGMGLKDVPAAASEAA